MSLTKVQASMDVPEYAKSLLDWSGPKKRKQFTPRPPQLKVVKIRPPQTPSARTPSREPSNSPPKRVAAPVSTSSTTSSLSSLTSLSSGSAADDLDARLSNKSKVNHASSASGAMHGSRDASLEPKDASSSPKRVREIDDASSFAEVSDVEEDASLKPSPSKRVKRAISLSTRATTSPSVSAGTSRASSPTPCGKASKTKKSASRNGGASTQKVRRRKKRALTDLTLPPKNGTYLGLAPVMVRNASTPLSSTAFESDSPMPPCKPRLERRTWTDEDGHVGDQLRTSEEVVKKSSKIGRYITFFKNPNDPDDTSYELSEYPTAELEYPNTGAKETFLLARPKDEDHYDPTLDIENTLRTFIKDIIPSEYKDVFGALPEDAIMNIVDAEDTDDVKPPSMPSDFGSTDRSIVVFSHSRQESTTSTLTSLSSDSDCASPPPPTSSPRCSPAPKSLMKTLSRARHQKNGPAYTTALKEINTCLRELKENADGNILREVPHTWSMDGIPQGVVLRIIEETYQRCVGPQINLLRKYEAFSSNVYGELTPAFVTDIIERTGLRSDSLFLDLGSGVGNVVLQAALQTGCTAFGIEEREDTARIADDQLEQMRLRCRMWGVSIGDVELVQGDMTKSPRVDELMSKADVVLVNNYVFSEELNAALRPKFLDLKEGAYVVSLKPFAPPNNQMLTERNFDDLSAIFDVAAHRYHSGTVSWTGGSGMYYIHHVNREGYRRNREAFEKLRRVERRRGGRR